MFKKRGGGACIYFWAQEGDYRGWWVSAKPGSLESAREFFSLPKRAKRGSVRLLAGSIEWAKELRQLLKQRANPIRPKPDYVNQWCQTELIMCGP